MRSAILKVVGRVIKREPNSYYKRTIIQGIQAPTKTYLAWNK